MLIDDFIQYRKKLNEIIDKHGNTQTKRFMNLDSEVYKNGAIDSKTKEMMGLVASMVLRCNDCINYHMIRCFQMGVKDEEFFELFNVALVVGGSIVIPHMRKATDVLQELREKGRNGETISF